MPEGQFSGERRTYLYTTDDGQEIYLLLLDRTLAELAGTGLLVANTVTATAASPKPQRFEPRVVFWQGEIGGRTVRKQLVCGTVSSALYALNTSRDLIVDQIPGSTTGKKGERLSFPKLEPAPPPDI
jgi:hypothetical protein